MATDAQDPYRPLLDDKLFPLLKDMAFIHADRDTAAKAWLDFKGPLLRAHGVEFSSTVVRGSLEQVVRQLEPLSMPTPERYLIVPCRNGWSLTLDNGAFGSDASSLLYGTVTRTRQRGVRLCITAPFTKKTGKRRILTVLWSIVEPGDGMTERITRSLAVQKEGSWHWDNAGEPLSFEETASYDAKRVSERFTPEMLVRYAKALGIDAYNEDFYLTHNPGAILLQISHVPFPNQKNHSLADVQRDWRWYDEV